MAAFQKLLSRLGYVKLGQFGLALTPEGRILSMRPAALDDGLGGRIVGWEDSDLAAMELGKWEPARPAPPRATATRVAVMPPPLPRVTAKVAVVAPPPPPPAPILVAPPAPMVAPVVVAPPAEPEEDWEWTIAIARARAAAEESELAAAAVRAMPPVAAPRPIVQLVPDASKTEKMAAVAMPRSEPVRPTLRVVPPADPVPARTVIPVPKLPTLGDRRVEPVVSGVRGAPPLHRIARGTKPLEQDTVTKVSAVAAEVDDEPTQTGIALPPVAALPSIRQRTSTR